MRYAILVAAVGVILLGCPNAPLPPFDTTGQYAGEWWGRTDEETPQVVSSSPLTMTLEQDLSKPYPGDHGVQGTVIVDYSGLELPEWVDEVPPADVSVTGLLADDGKLALASGGCGPGICILLLLAGEGFDTNGNGYMDTYTGDWSYSILLAGVRPFGVAGKFTVSAAD